LKRLVFIILLLPVVVSAETVSIPRDHFLGVSSPCATIVDARNEAFYDVAKQIVRTIGGRYDIRFESRMTQDGDKFRRYADERFRFAGEGFISEIENNIVSSRYIVADGGMCMRCSCISRVSSWSG